MRLNQMPGYNFPTLATCPKPLHPLNTWQLHELKLTDDGDLKWYPRCIENESGHAMIDCYDTYEAATAVSSKLNEAFINSIDSLLLDDHLKASLRLKVDKQITCQSRLLAEEQLMLQEAIRRHHGTPRPSKEDLILSQHHENLRDLLHEILSETPYIQCASLPKSGVILARSGELDWSKTIPGNKRAYEKVYRDRIARGFDLCGFEHWGKTKATIRTLLRPRANELLQLASVKRMLDSAYARGERVLISGSFVFWYESNGDVGWTIKEANRSAIDKAGNTIWKEGTIVVVQ
ncbi:hypothetical protein QKW35_20630 [Pontibacterium granulatum]|uniref:hypothetical protein n=1 Tax=Pontibacterium granulatum TaxID=2036029 RepID=UPI00249AFEBB|nr:hypothetical protein [Pontibacterium granulatum]MDI3326790.1 hypothetical protein [Pontibacterium granulatum]